MWYNIFHLSSTLILFFFVQNMLTSIVNHAIVISIVFIFASMYALTSDYRLMWVMTYGILIDMFSGLFFGFYTLFFLLVAGIYMTIEKNFLHGRDVSLFVIGSFAFVGITVITMAYEGLRGHMIFSGSYVISLLSQTLLSLVVFFLAAYLLHSSEQKVNTQMTSNSKKHI